jgi:hypothetical protein
MELLAVVLASAILGIRVGRLWAVAVPLALGLASKLVVDTGSHFGGNPITVIIALSVAAAAVGVALGRQSHTTR